MVPHWAAAGATVAWDRVNGSLWTYAPLAGVLTQQELSFNRDPDTLFVPSPRRRPGLRILNGPWGQRRCQSVPQAWR